MNDPSIEHPDLDDYLDGGESGRTDRVGAHVQACASCAAELSAMIELRNHARALPREVLPPRNLWAGIEERIVAAPMAPAPRAAALRPASASVHRRIGVQWLAAAATVLLVVSAGAAAYLWQGRDAPPAPIATTAARPAANNAIGLAAFASAETEYRYTVQTLEAELEARRETLSPLTIQTVEANLAIIDNAIAEARRALAADPTSADLPLLLSDVYRRKVELLRQAVNLSARS